MMKSQHHKALLKKRQSKRKKKKKRQPEAEDSLQTEEENESEEGSITIAEAFSAVKITCHFVMQTENTHEALEAINKLDYFWKNIILFFVHLKKKKKINWLILNK